MSAVVAAREHIRQDLSVPENAERLAESVRAALGQAPRVLVVMVGVRGVSSAFCNRLLELLDDALARVAFEYDTETQRRVMERSIEVMRTDRV